MNVFFFHFQVLIFDRPVKDCPLFFDVTDHNPPLISFGSRGGAKEKGFFMQPCNVTVDDLGQVYVVDTGNSRIKKLTSNLDFIDHVTNEGLEGRSATGICMGSSRDSLMVINWRTKMVTEMTLDGNTIGNSRILCTVDHKCLSKKFHIGSIIFKRMHIFTNNANYLVSQIDTRMKILLMIKIKN